MNFNKLAGIAATTVALCLNVGGDLQAASSSVACTRIGNIRSIAVVAGSGIGTGSYYALVLSGGKVYKSGVKSPNALGRISFPFDSSVTAGTTRIPANFIQNRRVDGYIRQAGSNLFIAGIGAICTIK